MNTMLNCFGKTQEHYLILGTINLQMVKDQFISACAPTTSLVHKKVTPSIYSYEGNEKY